MHKARILVVEDEAIIAKDLQWRLEGMGYEVPCVISSGEEAITAAAESKPDLILMDIMLTGAMDGIETAGRISSIIDIPIIYLTAYADDEILERAKVSEPFGYLIKPIGDRELHSNIEITLHKHIVDRKLRESEKWHSTVLSSIGDAVITTNAKGLIKSINPSAEKLTGWKRDEAARKPVESVLTILNEQTGSPIEIPDKKTTESVNHRTILLTRKGTRVPIDINIAPIRDKNISSAGLVIVFSDVTERRRSEEQLLQSKKSWEDTFNTITDMVTVLDKDFNIVRANRSAREMLRLPDLESTHAKCYKYYHGTDSPPDNCPSCICCESHESSTLEFFEPNLNMFIEMRVMPRFDKDGEFIGLIHVTRDITERKKFEEEIKKAKVEWEMTFDSASEFIILVDKELNISRCNVSFARFTNSSVQEIIGRKCSEFFPCDAARADDSKPVSNIEVRTEDGHWLYLSSYSILNDKEEFLHTIIIATDITDLKNTQQKLLNSEDELRHRVKELEDFYEMAVGRELKMKELKSEIAKLSKQIDKN